MRFCYNKRCVLVIIFLKTFIIIKATENLHVTYDTGVKKFQNLDKYLQPNDLLSGKYDLTDPGKYRCARDCDLYREPRLCYHKFVFEPYHVMGPACDGCPDDLSACYKTHCVPADGVERMITAINRQLCSPAIMVCRGDRIVVDVINKLSAKSTSIHWHGLHMAGYGFFDGVPNLTQCPINDGTTFRYDFPVEQVGDYLYHSHSAIQMDDGIQGPLIVRTRKREEPYFDDYDLDLFSHTLFVQDWMHAITDDKIPGYNNIESKFGINPTTYLINGHGNFQTEGGNYTNTPYTVFNVVRGKRHRFRIISSVNAGAILTIEGHDFELISTDASFIRKIPGRSLFLTSGERFSIIITADKAPRSYWIKVNGVADDCVQYAILRYVNENGSNINGSPLIPQTKKPTEQAPVLNDVRSNCDPSNSSAICVDQLEALNPSPLFLTQPEPNYRLILRVSFHDFTPEELYIKGKYSVHYSPGGGYRFVGGGMWADVYNNVSSFMPSFPLLTQNEPIQEDLVCDSNCFSYNSYCQCFVIYKVPLDAVVEIVLIDDTFGGDGNVPIFHSHHLHGYSFRVVKVGGKDEMKTNPHFYMNTIPRGYKSFPLKDNILTPFNGYAILRFWATNPGLWLFHCHTTKHNNFGMKVVLQVGERDQFPKPPCGFPTCGDFVPDVVFP